jgi:HTH-type transcriptional regulator/antitoxin HigA
MLDAELERDRAGYGEDIEEEERVANAAAADFCVPSKTLAQFIARKAPVFTRRDILGFSSLLSLHPGLVAGQLQRATGHYDRFRDHLIPVRATVLPNVVHDGWGDVASISQ